MNLKDVLNQLHACNESQAWASEQSAEQAYRTCERGDWMLWLAAKLSVDKKPIVLAACECAEQAMTYVPKDETRPAKAIETARAWCRGEATLEEVLQAADAAKAAWAVEAAGAAVDAAWAAVDAAKAAWAAARAADADARADAWAAVDARATSLKQSADIVRKHIPLEVFLDKLNGVC